MSSLDALEAAEPLPPEEDLVLRMEAVSKLRGRKKAEKKPTFVHKRYIYLFGGECNPPSAADIAKERELDPHDHSHDDEKKAEPLEA